jgi:putative ABC transport system permease protein
MSYTLATLWHERQRYLPGILAVAFSALLIALQTGLLLGLFSISSLPVDRTHADVWLGAPGVLSVDLGRPIPEEDLAQLYSQPEIERCEVFLQGFAYWSKPDGGIELCMVVGSSLEPDALGLVDALTEEHRVKLQGHGNIVVDRSDLERLGLSKDPQQALNSTAEVSGRQVRVVGLTSRIKSLAGPYVFCNVTTARDLLRLMPGQVTYVLGRCKPGHDPQEVVRRLREQYDKDPQRARSVFTSAEFSSRSQIHWLTKTKAGIALGLAAALGLLVGAVVTSQTLYAATAAQLRELAVLRALGIPRWRMALMVLSQAFWVGVIGIGLAYPAVHLLARLADYYAGVQVLLLPSIQIGAAGVTLVMAVLSGLFALRSLRLVEPAMLLR